MSQRIVFRTKVSTFKEQEHEVSSGKGPVPRGSHPVNAAAVIITRSVTESARPAHIGAHPLTSVTRKTGERGRGRSAHIEHTSIFNQKEISSPFALVLVAHVVSPATETEHAGSASSSTETTCLKGSAERPPGAACDQHGGRSQARNRRRRTRGGGKLPTVMQHARRRPPVSQCWGEHLDESMRSR